MLAKSGEDDCIGTSSVATPWSDDDASFRADDSSAPAAFWRCNCRRVRAATPASLSLSSLPRGGGACSTSREPFSAGIEASNASIDAGLDPGADVVRPIH